MRKNNEIKITKPTSKHVEVKPLPNPSPEQLVARAQAALAALDRWFGEGSL